MSDATENIDYGKAEYCKHCWACYHGIRCIAPLEARNALCEKAKARMNGGRIKECLQEQPTNDYKDVKVKEFVRYISQRIAYLKILIGGIPSNEYKYYCALKEAIKEWGKAHVIFYGCLYGKISVERAKSILGVSESTFFRIMKKQRKDLIDFIEKQENILNVKYPFIPMADIFE